MEPARLQLRAKVLLSSLPGEGTEAHRARGACSGSHGCWVEPTPRTAVPPTPATARPLRVPARGAPGHREELKPRRLQTTLERTLGPHVGPKTTRSRHERLGCRWRSGRVSGTASPRRASGSGWQRHGGFDARDTRGTLLTRAQARGLSAGRLRPLPSVTSTSSPWPDLRLAHNATWQTRVPGKRHGAT